MGAAAFEGGLPAVVVGEDFEIGEGDVGAADQVEQGNKRRVGAGESRRRWMMLSPVRASLSGAI